MLTIEESNIPPVPTELILTYDEILKQPIWTTHTREGKVYEVDWYKVYVANESLQQWIRAQFDSKIECIEYIIAYRALDLHRDMERTRAFNYVIQAGGALATEVLDYDKETVLNSVICKPLTWYYLNVDLPHRVVGELTEPRIIISVTPSAYFLPKPV